MWVLVETGGEPGVELMGVVMETGGELGRELMGVVVRLGPLLYPTNAMAPVNPIARSFVL